MTASADGPRTGAPEATATHRRDAAATIPLSAVAAGRRVRVVGMDRPEDPLILRLKTMGLHEGRLLQVLRGGDRLIVACGGTRIGLASGVARCVQVVEDEAGA